MQTARARPDRQGRSGSSRSPTTFAAPAYSSLEPSELDQLIADLEPISARLDAAGSW
jgi:hypothetical protein